MSDRDPVEMQVVSDFIEASDRPVFGERRLVYYLPVGLPGTKGHLVPCIWMSPYVTFDKDLKENVRLCIVLLGKGTSERPKPEIICVRIPAAAIDKFPKGPVEW